MNILSIGNSFSQDAQRYLNRIAAADGVALDTFNLCIGGCSLAKHYRNMLGDFREYILEMNGQSTNFKVSLQEALLNREWDVITLQQVSHESINYDSYQPYLNELVEYIHRCAPKAKLAWHQTWAYEQGSQRLKEMVGYNDQRDMFLDIQEAGRKAAQAIRADYIFPVGEVFQGLIAKGIEQLHRDTFHASRGVGRYAIALTWYAALTGRDVMGNSFDDFDEAVLPEQKEIAKKCVTEVMIRGK